MGYPLRDTLALIARRCVRRSRALSVDMRLGAVGASGRAQRPADLSDTGLTIMLRPWLWLSSHLKVGDYKLPDRAVPARQPARREVLYRLAARRQQP